MTAGVVKPARDIRELDIDGELTLFHEATSTALVLNGTASDVWRLLDGSTTVDEIVRLLSGTYGTDADVVRPGVEAALAQFAEHRLLVDEPPA